jgi:hypothetical protein
MRGVPLNYRWVRLVAVLLVIALGLLIGPELAGYHHGPTFSDALFGAKCFKLLSQEWCKTR